MKENIVLIGFMGTGKTTVGKLISEKLGRDFVDSDDYIESRYNMKIKNIFDIHGEEYFRDLERKAIAHLSKKSKLVIATGGGIVLDKTNIDKLREKGTIYLLNGSIDTIKRNLVNSRSNRPLLIQYDWIDKIKSLLSSRKELYFNSADHIINIDNKIPYEISEDIIRLSTI